MKRLPTLLSACGAVLGLLTGFAETPVRADDAMADLVAKVHDSIVRVEWAAETESGGMMSATGTGFVIEDEGQLYIVTNWHVVDTSEAHAKGPVHITLRRNNMEQSYAPIPCEIVGTDQMADLAVLKAPGLQAMPLPFSDPKTIRTGMDVVVIGFALGLEGEASVTQGILSAQGRDRNMGMISGLLQTNAATNPGNSGGPWLNRKGEVIGVHTYGEGPELVVDQGGKLVMENGKPKIENKQCVNMARSVATAAPMVHRIIHEGAVRRTSLGFTFGTFPSEIGALCNLAGGARVVERPVDAADRVTAPVLEAKTVLEAGGNPSPFGGHVEYVPVPEGSRGFNADDIITSVEANGVVWGVHNAGDLLNVLGVLPAGTKVRVSFQRLKETSALLRGMAGFEPVIPGARKMDNSGSGMAKLDAVINSTSSFPATEAGLADMLKKLASPGEVQQCFIEMVL